MSREPIPLPADAQGSSKDPSRPERRAAVRYASGLRAFCQSSPGQVEAIWWRALVRDLSQRGMTLLVGHQFEPGTLLIVDLLSPPANGCNSLRVRVVHATPQASRHWTIGCEFVTKFSDEELQALL